MAGWTSPNNWRFLAGNIMGLNARCSSKPCLSSGGQWYATLRCRRSCYVPSLRHHWFRRSRRTMTRRRTTATSRALRLSERPRSGLLQCKVFSGIMTQNMYVYIYTHVICRLSVSIEFYRYLYDIYIYIIWYHRNWRCFLLLKIHSDSQLLWCQSSRSKSSFGQLLMIFYP